MEGVGRGGVQSAHIFMLDVLLDEWIICRAVVHPVAVPTRAMVLAVAFSAYRKVDV